MYNIVIEPSEDYAEQNRPISKCDTENGSIYMTILKWQNHTNGGQVRNCQGLKKGAGGK